MRISTILLSNDYKKVFKKIHKEGNVDYLVKGEDNSDFPYLGEVESYDFSIFFPRQMDEIIKELLVVRENLTDPSDQHHVNDIIHLAKKCKNTPDTLLMFKG